MTEHRHHADARALEMRWRTGWVARDKTSRQSEHPDCWHGADASATHAHSIGHHGVQVMSKSELAVSRFLD